MTIYQECISSGPQRGLVLVFGSVLLILAGCGRESQSVPRTNEPPGGSSEMPTSSDATARGMTPEGVHSSAVEKDSSQREPPVQPDPAPPAQQVLIDEPGFRDAALAGQIEVIRQALDAGVDVNSSDEARRTALLFASFNGHTRVVKLLLDNGASLAHRDATGRTALMYAASGANDETVRLLLEAGADPNVSDRDEKFTALMHAAAEGQTAVVRTLLEHKADATLRDVDGDTARDFAVQNRHAEVVRLLTE